MIREDDKTVMSRAFETSAGSAINLRLLQRHGFLDTLTGATP